MADSPFSGATLGPCVLDASAPIHWTETPGVEPWVATLHCDSGEAGKLTVGQPYTLSIWSGAERLDVERIYYMGAAATIDPNRTALVVADFRIWWRRKHLLRRYNIRTRTGERRRLDPDGSIPDEVAPVVNDVFYKSYSLKGGTDPHTPSDVLADVLDALEGPGTWDLDSGSVPERYVDDLEIDMRGDEALATALAHFSGLEVVATRRGRARVYSRHDLVAAQRIMDTVRPRRGPYEGEDPRFVNLSRSRPAHVVGLLTIEQEVRFDSLQEGETITPDTRYCENVLQVPDPSLTLADGRVVVQGTWITVEQAFAAWNLAKGESQELPDLSHEVVQALWFTSALEGAFGELGKLSPSILWLQRIRAIRRHYRQTYRINRRWIQKIHSFRPYRVALLDFETGQFAASPVYGDWCAVFNERGLLASIESQYVGFNVDGSVAPGTPLSEAEPAPAVLEVLDMEQGIVHVAYQQDMLGHLHMIFPSKADGLPSIDSKTWNSRSFFHDGTEGADGSPPPIALDGNHRVSFVVTVVPGTPNDNQQLYAIEVHPGDVREFLPPGTPPFDSYGPAWTVRVGAGVATARFAWSHEKRDEIERSLGVGDTDGTDRKDIEDLLQNPAAIADYVRVMAASIYTSMRDHWHGTVRALFTPGVQIEGNVSTIEHSLVDGRLATTVVFASDLAPADPWALLPKSARVVLQRMVQP